RVWRSNSLWLWVLVADLTVIVVLFCWWRSRRGSIAWLSALLPHLPVLAVAVLLAVGWFNSAAVRALELLVCGLVATGWVVAIGVPVALAMGTLLRSRGSNAALPKGWLRLWVATASFLVTGEAAVWLIESARQRNEVQLTLPEAYGEAAPEQRPVVALGGSTMLGFPSQPKIGIPEVLGEMLQELQPD